MKLTDFVKLMETIAPPELALGFDNPGLLIDPAEEEIAKVMLALDATPAVVREAAEWGAQLILTHHPLFFSPVKHVLKRDPETAAAWLMLKKGIGLYAAHTNLDAAEGGVNDALMAALGVTVTEKLGEEQLGRAGVLPETMPLAEFAKLCAEKLGTHPAYTGKGDTPVKKVACVSGAGASEMELAVAAGADAFVTGEIKHHETLAADVLGMPVVVCGHYETERVVLEPLKERLERACHCNGNDVLYKVALQDAGALTRI
ncbi:MAG: Nif3-like dinuclear metal center hexameric protein [Clostridia bacterium]|nr:Nif3-like dinuclear metal center hexameric protein [Clostridia bacterium]